MKRKSENPYPDDPREGMRGGVHTAYEEGKQDQLEDDEKVMRELFEEIEKVYGKSFGSKQIFIGVIPSEDWQALKEKYLGKST